MARAETPICPKLGNAIMVARKAIGITQAELAAELGLQSGASHICLLEAGRFRLAHDRAQLFFALLLKHKKQEEAREVARHLEFPSYIVAIRHNLLDEVIAEEAAFARKPQAQLRPRSTRPAKR